MKAITIIVLCVKNDGDFFNEIDFTYITFFCIFICIGHEVLHVVNK